MPPRSPKLAYGFLTSARVQVQSAEHALTGARLTAREVLPEGHDALRDLDLALERVQVTAAKLDSLARRLA